MESTVRALAIRKTQEIKVKGLEREKGFEPSTLALARRCSTTELFPLEKIA
jgi:hypothetical protein